MRSMEKRMLFSVVVVLVAASLPIVCAGPLFAGTPARGGALRLCDVVEGASFGYPPKLLRTPSIRQAAPAVETLLRMDSAGKPVPWLATGYKENAKAGTLTLTLRKGVKFHDATDFNAEAVKWNLDQCMRAKAQGTEKFRSVDVVDDYTVRISLTAWDSTVTSNLAQTIGMMISPTAYKKNGEEWCSNHPVGTGAYEFVSWQKDVRLAFRRYDGYWQKGKPYLDAVVWTPIPDSLTREFSLKKGELDVMLTLAAKGLTDLEKEGYAVSRKRVGSGARTLIPDSSNAKSPFADIRVRQAVTYAIDNTAIVKAVFYGENEAASQWAYRGHWGYNESVAGYPYNPAKAKQLLAAAGHPSGFKTKLTYLTNPELDQVMTAVQAYLKAVGIEAELDPAQAGRYDQVARGGKWEGVLMGAASGNPEIAGVLSAMFAGGTGWYTMMATPEDYTRAIQNAIAAPDFKTKQKWVREVQRLMIDKYALQTPLYCMSEFGAMKASVHNHGLAATPNTAWTPEDVWLER